MSELPAAPVVVHASRTGEYQCVVERDANGTHIARLRHHGPRGVNGRCRRVETFDQAIAWIAKKLAAEGGTHELALELEGMKDV